MGGSRLTNNMSYIDPCLPWSSERNARCPVTRELSDPAGQVPVQERRHGKLMSKAMFKWAPIALSVIAHVSTDVLALPVRQAMAHREVPLPELVYSPLPHDAAKPARVWIDADAACGAGKHRDPDKCLALLSLASASDIDIAGISTGLRQRPRLRNRPGDAHTRAET